MTASPRTITLNLDNNELTEIATSIESWDALWGAIGYLSAWNTSYPYVQIFRDSNSNDLVASYRDVSGDRQYVIGAVWHDDHYGYHS